MTSDYITPEELRDYIGSDTSNYAAHVQACATSASRGIEKLCGRYFNQDGSATARYFTPCDYYTVDVDDISTATGLLVATDDHYDGTFSTSWTINTDFILRPRNPSSTGVTYPYTQLAGTASFKFFPPAIAWRHETVQVTAKWGWAAVPDEVKHAAKILGAWLFGMKDAPDGFIGLDGWGPRFYKENKAAQALLGPFMRDPISVA